MNDHYEVAVIGGGPGGYVSAILAARAGKKTCLVEAERLGGTCLNVGCIPTKVLVKSASLLQEFRCAETFGITGLNSADLTVDMAALQNRKQAVINQLVGGVDGLLRSSGVKQFHGTASFLDAHQLCINQKETLTADSIIVATGSETVLPSSIRREGNCRVLTSTDALALDHLPKSIAILGGGIIGIEFAYLLNQMGCQVTVLEMLPEILPMADREIAALARGRLEKDGVRFYLGAKVTCLKDQQVYFELQDQQQELQAEAVLMALGRRSVTESLHPDAAGLHVEHGVLVCDQQMRTNQPHIYAVGDVNGQSMMAHTAYHEAEVAVDNLCGGHSTMRYDRVPTCIYTDPEIACVGLSEEQARERYGNNIKIGRFPAFANGKSLVEGDTDGLFKVILDGEFGEILGVHLYGKHVTEMIAQASLAMESEATAEEVIASVQPHPTVSESIGEMFRAAWLGHSIHYN